MLVVAWWFPPLSGGGVHRPLQFVRHLVRRGLRVSVVTAVPRAGDRLDEELLASVPAEVRIVRVPLLDPFRAWGWLKGLRGSANGAVAERAASPPSAGARVRVCDLLSEAIALPDRWLPWIPLATARAALALRGDEPDLVFSTSPPHSMHLVGRALAGLFGCPLVIDFRDPWMGNPFRRYATPLLRRIDAALEQRVVEAAAQVVLNTPALERQFKARYDGFTRARTIPNGFDPEAFAHLPPPAGRAPGQLVEIAHFGQLYGLRSGKYLLEALAVLKRERPELLAKLRITFIGSIDHEAGFRALASQHGVAEVLSIPGALSHGASLARQRESDVLLLLGPENREPEVQVPGKLYEYFAAERPILTLSRQGGAIAEILELAKVPYERAEPDDPLAIASAIARACATAADGGRTAAARAGTAKFRYDQLGDRLLDCFAEAWRSRSPALPASA